MARKAEKWVVIISVPIVCRLAIVVQWLFMIFGNLEKKENNNNKCRRIRAESFNGLKHISFLGKFFFCMQNKHVFFHICTYNPSLIKPILYKKSATTLISLEILRLIWWAKNNRKIVQEKKYRITSSFHSKQSSPRIPFKFFML